MIIKELQTLVCNSFLFAIKQESLHRQRARAGVLFYGQNKKQIPNKLF